MHIAHQAWFQGLFFFFLAISLSSVTSGMLAAAAFAMVAGVRTAVASYSLPSESEMNEVRPQIDVQGSELPTRDNSGRARRAWRLPPSSSRL